MGVDVLHLGPTCNLLTPVGGAENTPFPKALRSTLTAKGAPHHPRRTPGAGPLQAAGGHGGCCDGDSMWNFHSDLRVDIGSPGGQQHYTPRSKMNTLAVISHRHAVVTGPQGVLGVAS